MVEMTEVVNLDGGELQKFGQQGFYLFLVGDISLDNPQDIFRSNYLATKNICGFETESGSKRVPDRYMLNNIADLFFFVFLEVLDVLFDAVDFGGL